MLFTAELGIAQATPGSIEPGVGPVAAPCPGTGPRQIRLAAGRSTSVFIPAGLDVNHQLQAAAAVSFHLAAEQATSHRLAAQAATRHNLSASEAMAVTSHISMVRGEDVSLNFQMTPPIDITGWTLTFKCADKLGGTVQFTLTPSKPDAARGQFLVFIGHTLTSSLAVGRYVWDVRRSDVNNYATLAGGTLEIKQEVVA